MNSDIIHRLTRSMAADSATPDVGEGSFLSSIEMSLLKDFRELSFKRRQALLQLLTDE